MTSPSQSEPQPRRERERERESLEETLRRAAGGDDLAWREVIETYTPRVFGLIKAQCGNGDLAAEITQSTFCTIVAKIGGYTELGRFEAWLFRIAMNRFRDEMRRRKRHATAVEDEALIGLAGADPGAANPAGGLGVRGQGALGAGQTAEPAEIQALWQAVSQLPEADQSIIHLRHFAGLSFKQIAELLEQPLGTVLARQHRALKKLKELLGGEEE